MYRKGESAGYNQGQIDKWIFDRYKVQDPRNMNREQYEEACAILDNTAARNAQTAADNQGGNVNA